MATTAPASVVPVSIPGSVVMSVASSAPPTIPAPTFSRIGIHNSSGSIGGGNSGSGGAASGLGPERWMDAHLQHCIGFLSDVRDFVKERAELEREFARKLESLARRHAHRRERRSGAPPPPPSSLGSDQRRVSRDMGEGSIVEGEVDEAGSVSGVEEEVDHMDGLSTTTERAWGAILLGTENRARAHLALSSSLSQSISDRLKTLAAKREEGRKKHILFSQKLVTEREKFYAEKDKAKKEYDDACDQVETLKAKHDRSSDSRVKEKLKKAWQDETLDLNNAKNLYVLAIDMANAVKKKYYCQDLPHLLKDMQELAESTIQGLKNIWTSYAEEETQFLDACRRHTTSLTSTISLVDPVCDADPRGPQFWFSLRQQHEGSSEVTAPPLPLAPQPPDFVFVPSIMWREKAEVGKDDASRTYMVNLVRTLRKQLEKLDKEVAVRSRGVEGMKVLMEAYTKNPNQGDAFDVKENILEINRELTLLMNARTKLKTNIDFIVASVGDECPSDRFHTFKTAAFAIPTSCDQCRQTIWGVAKTGLWCTQCGFSAHVKCELKIAPTCSGVRIARSRAGRPKSMCSHRTSTPTISRPVHLESVSAQAEVGSLARVLYDYEPPSDAPEDEIAVTEGESVSIIEVDDGSGWTKVLCGESCGLVPTAYIQIKPSAAPASHINPGIPMSRNPSAPPAISHIHQSAASAISQLEAAASSTTLPPTTTPSPVAVASSIFINPPPPVPTISPAAAASASTTITHHPPLICQEPLPTPSAPPLPVDTVPTLPVAREIHIAPPIVSPLSHTVSYHHYRPLPQQPSLLSVQAASYASVHEEAGLRDSSATLGDAPPSPDKVSEVFHECEGEFEEGEKERSDGKMMGAKIVNNMDPLDGVITNANIDGPICVKTRALFDYSEHGEDEISMKAGQELFILEKDDGSGWVTVHDGMREGLVPASYLELR